MPFVEIEPGRIVPEEQIPPDLEVEPVREQISAPAVRRKLVVLAEIEKVRDNTADAEQKAIEVVEVSRPVQRALIMKRARDELVQAKARGHIAYNNVEMFKKLAEKDVDETTTTEVTTTTMLVMAPATAVVRELLEEKNQCFTLKMVISLSYLYFFK